LGIKVIAWRSNCPLPEGISGTRLTVLFINTPTNVHILVTPINIPIDGKVTLRAFLILAETAYPVAEPGAEILAGRWRTIGGFPLQELIVRGGIPGAVWECVNTMQRVSLLRSLSFAVVLAFEPCNSWLATTTVNGSLAPRSTVTTAAERVIPRFADTSTSIAVFKIEQ
jgi:hypothetical protein